MSQIIIELPEDRNCVGSLRLVNDKGVDVAGPFAACGRADRKTAGDRGNPTGDPLKPYGDTPYGTFAVVDIVKTGEGSAFNRRDFGEHGAIRLKPAEGDAALAGRAGRTGFMIHAGEAAPRGGLKPTNGSVRLADEDLRALLEAIALLTINESFPSTCLIKRGKSGAALVAADEGYDAGDPPQEMRADWHALAVLTGARPGRAGGEAGATQREGHDRDAHDRDAHDRDAHDRDAHDRDAHDRDVHDREADREPASVHEPERGHDRAAQHDRDAHDRGP